MLSKPETRRALRPLRPRRPSLRRLPARPLRLRRASPTCSPRSSATTSLGARAGRSRGRRPRRRGRDRPRRGRTRSRPATCRCASRWPARTVRATGPSPARRSRSARRAAARGGGSRCRAASSASSCARRRALRAVAPDGGSRRRARCASGAGRVLEERSLDVEIPPGIHDGQQIRLSGEGHAGALGARAGDVYVRVHVRHDERFVREGNDIFSTVDLTMTQAALGATVTVPTLDGDEELEFAPGTQPGVVRRPARARHAGAAGLRPRRPAPPRQRRRAAPAHRRAAPPARASSRRTRASTRTGRRGLLRQAEERVPALKRYVDRPAARPSSPLLSTSSRRGSRSSTAAFAVYADGAAARLRRRRGRRRAPRDGRTRGARSTTASSSAACGSGRRGSRHAAGVIPVAIDPGRAFGTGAHPTTRLCLELLQEVEPGEPARRRLRLGRALDRRGEARLRAGQRDSTSTTSRSR